MSYIVAIDIGSSNTKIVIMKIENDTSSIFYMDILEDVNIDKLEDIVDSKLYNIHLEKESIKIVLLTGSGSSYFTDKFLDIRILKVDEFTCIGYGGILLSKKDKALIVNIGTGTTIVYSDLDNVEYLGGTGLGGGTFIGLGKRFFGEISRDEIYEKLKIGNSNNVNLLISDISKEEILNLKFDITASNFAGYKKKANDSDIVAGFLKLITENIGLTIKHIKDKCDMKYNEDLPVVLMGTFLLNDDVKKYFSSIQYFTGVNYTYIEDKYISFTTCIGLYEYYMLRERYKIINE